MNEITLPQMLGIWAAVAVVAGYLATRLCKDLKKDDEPCN